MKNKLNVICPYCGKPAELVDSICVYKRSYGNIWLCRPCNAYVGVHKNSKNNIPTGRLANKELRQWKKNAHNMLDFLWQYGGMSRVQVYAELADFLQIEPKNCHIAMFDVETCKDVVEFVKQVKEELKEKN